MNQQLDTHEEGKKVIDSSQSQLMADIEAKKSLDDDLKKRLTDAIKDYKQGFLEQHKKAETVSA